MMGRYDAFGYVVFIPGLDVEMVGSFDDLQLARDAVKGYELAFIYDHEVGHNVDSLLSTDYKKRVGVFEDTLGGWRSERKEAKREKERNLFQRWKARFK